MAHAKSFQLKLDTDSGSGSGLVRFRFSYGDSPRERLPEDVDVTGDLEAVGFAQLGRPHCFWTCLAWFFLILFTNASISSKRLETHLTEVE